MSANQLFSQTDHFEFRQFFPTQIGAGFFSKTYISNPMNRIKKFVLLSCFITIVLWILPRCNDASFEFDHVWLGGFRR